MRQRKIIVIRILFALLLLGTFFSIFQFSAQEGEASSGLSKKIVRGIIDNFVTTKDLPEAEKLILIENWNSIVRKLAHFSIYALVGIWTMALIHTYELSERKKWIGSLGVGILYAVLDEFHQSFIPDRAASIIDVGIDTLGVITGILIVFVIIKIMNQRKSQKRKEKYS